MSVSYTAHISLCPNKISSTQYEIDVDSQLIDAVLRGQRKLLLGD